jgi:hypothetical protein
MPETPFMPGPEEPMGPEIMPEIPEEAPGEIGGVTFTALDLPQVVDWMEGEEYDVAVRVRLVSKEERDGVTTADFDIISADAGAEEPPMEPPMEGPMMPPV